MFPVKYFALTKPLLCVGRISLKSYGGVNLATLSIWNIDGFKSCLCLSVLYANYWLVCWQKYRHWLCCAPMVTLHINTGIAIGCIVGQRLACMLAHVLLLVVLWANSWLVCWYFIEHRLGGKVVLRQMLIEIFFDTVAVGCTSST